LRCREKSVTQQIIEATVGLIIHFSIPEIIYSHGGPQLLETGKFEDFWEEWVHQTSVIITLHAPIK
jgi:hypothetical protein